MSQVGPLGRFGREVVPSLFGQELSPKPSPSGGDICADFLAG